MRFLASRLLVKPSDGLDQGHANLRSAAKDLQAIVSQTKSQLSRLRHTL